ncbi:VanW family protein [Pseudonocardia asaccharolytica]|uniref:VanW family protein n=1 Tax=Pseudonocardia asaccharolytica TaxID=54010 RepID=UPI001FDFDBAB|nr:VanW family protein [Pseudonocardia asaccharolytica]
MTTDVTAPAGSAPGKEAVQETRQAAAEPGGTDPGKASAAPAEPAASEAVATESADPGAPAPAGNRPTADAANGDGSEERATVGEAAEDRGAAADSGSAADAAAGPCLDGDASEATPSDASAPAAAPPAPAGSAASAAAAPAAPQGSATPAARAPDEQPTQTFAAVGSQAGRTPGAPARPGAAPVGGPWDVAATQVIPVSAATGPARTEQPTDRIVARAAGGVEQPTERIQMPPTGRPPAGAAGRPRRRKRLLIGAAVVGLLAVLYTADVLLSLGSVPRGVKVAGLEVGGLSRADAEQQLRAAIGPRTTQPVTVTAGEVQSEIDPRTAGLKVDWTATLDQAGSQPLNPITRITSFFTTREVGVVNTADERSVTTAMEQLAPLVDTPPTEGNVRFEGTTPIPVEPVDGRKLDVAAAVKVLERDWASGRPVDLPLIPLPAATTVDDVQQAIDTVAVPAVSAPVTITGEGAQATLTPTAIASALSFRADPEGSPKLVPEINIETVTDAVKPQLASTEKPGRDASIDFSSGSPVVVPSQDGRGVDYDATFKDLLTVLTSKNSPRQVTAVYADQPAKLTTDELNKLGIVGEISSFTTGGFAADSGRNIRRAAEQINGTIVKPGETLSLNAVTNPRNRANGYVEAGIIEDGHPARGVGGGVSQVATTLYNAAYFAGMVDVAHKEHSYYISRYPVAREATVFDNVIDLKFRNDGPTGVLIQTIWTPRNLTVKMFGTKRYEVTSTTGPRTNQTPPSTVTIPAGKPCSPSQGAPGFTATDTRTLRNLQTGATRSETRTVKYNPSPIVVCGG